MTKPKEGKIKEKFEKKLRKLLDEAHLLGKQSWEGDKVDNLEIEEFSSWFEKKLKEEYTRGYKQKEDEFQEMADKLKNLNHD